MSGVYLSRALCPDIFARSGVCMDNYTVYFRWFDGSSREQPFLAGSLMQAKLRAAIMFAGAHEEIIPIGYRIDDAAGLTVLNYPT